MDHKKALTDILKQQLGRINQEDMDVEIMEMADSPDYKIYFSKRLNVFQLKRLHEAATGKRMTTGAAIIESMRNFLTSMKESDLTKEYRDKIDTQQEEINKLRNQNKEFVDYLVSKNKSLAKLVYEFYKEKK
jgi:hypothetical protein